MRCFLSTLPQMPIATTQNDLSGPHWVLNRFLLILGRESEREKTFSWLPPACPLLSIEPAIQACVLSGNQAGDLLVLGMALNQPGRPCTFLRNLILACFPAPEPCSFLSSVTVPGPQKQSSFTPHHTLTVCSGLLECPRRVTVETGLEPGVGIGVGRDWRG